MSQHHIHNYYDCTAAICPWYDKTTTYNINVLFSLVSSASLYSA